MARFNLGDDVFVREPGRYVNNARSLTGLIDRIIPIGSSFKYEFEVGSVAINTGPGQFDFVWKRVGRVSIFETDLGLRVGYPLSQLDGRNGGNANWRALSESWGYP